jgi:hypothetical protein
VACQQFSTPAPLAFATATAAAITPDDLVLEPSAGNGLLAIFSELAGIVLNELAERRVGLLAHLLPAVPVTRFDAVQIADHHDPVVASSVVLMNPPLSAMAHVQRRMLDTPLAHFPQATGIGLAQGILFVTHATLRYDDRGERVSRVRRIIDLLGSDVDGVIVLDGSHAMQYAAGMKGECGEQVLSQHGKAGFRLQHALPDSGVVHVSATGVTIVHNLAYAQRLGLWGGEDYPFATRDEFVDAIEAGSVAAREVMARELRGLGLYTARSLSYDGVKYELVKHQLTPKRIFSVERIGEREAPL